MNCARLQQMLDAWIDGEIDASTGAEIERHLQGCGACAALRDARGALRAALRSEVHAFAAPAGLRASVGRAIDGAENPSRHVARRPTWLQAGAVALSAAIISAAAGFWAGRPAPERSTPEQVVASHVASLGHTRGLIDIASSDRHVVKPWFQGKVDFAPAVRDLSAEGYVLAGARMDHVAERQAAAVVYRLRGHVINLFVWPASAPGDEAVALATARGFNLAGWTESGLRYVAVSDADTSEMQRFARLVRALR